MKRYPVALIVACLVLSAATGVSAQGVVPLPGATGAFEQDLVTGVLELPGALATGPTLLRVSGSLAPGTVSYCDREGEFARGSEIHLYVGPGCSGFVVATGDIDLAAEAGEFVAVAPMLGSSGAPFDLSIIAGPAEFAFHVGYHPDETPVCVTPLTPTVVTISAVELVAEGELPSDRPTWGAVKALYR